MRLECTELREFIDLVGEDRAIKALSSFSVRRNPDVENFIRNNAVAYEKSDNARTYLVTNENDDILGYFSLALSVVDIPSGISKAMMKKMRGFGRYSADSVPCYLLGQLARDDNASHDDLMMQDFIDFAIEYVMAAKQYVGGRFLLIDCVDDLVELYEKYDFIRINKTGDLNQLIMFLE